MSCERENLIHQEMLKADVDVVLSRFFISFEMSREIDTVKTLVTLIYQIQGKSRMLLNSCVI